MRRTSLLSSVSVEDIDLRSSLLNIRMLYCFDLRTISGLLYSEKIVRIQPVPISKFKTELRFYKYDIGSGTKTWNEKLKMNRIPPPQYPYAIGLRITVKCMP